MGYRRTYQSDPINLASPFFIANIANGELADNHYSIFSYKTSDAPSGVAYCLWARYLDSGDPCNINWAVFRWDGISGVALGNVPSGDGLGRNLPLDVMRESRDGQTYVADVNTGSIHPWGIRGSGTAGFQMTPTTPLLKYGGLTVTNWTGAPYFCDDCTGPYSPCNHHQLIEVLELINEILGEMNEKL